MERKFNGFKGVLAFFVFLFLVNSAFSFSVELVKTDPSPIVAGDYADVTLRFTNIDDKSRSDVSFKLDDNEYFTQVSSSNNVIREVLAGESITRTFRIFFSEDLEQGFVELEFNIYYDNRVSSNKVEVFVEKGKRKPEILIGQIETIPNELIRDSDDNKIFVNLQNLGDKDAELLSANLVFLDDDAKASYTYSLTDSISKIEGGSEAELEFTVDIEEDASDLIPAVLEIRYRAERGVGNVYETYFEKLNFSIPLSSSPYLVIENVELLDGFLQGSTENKVLVTIKNEGDKEAEDIRVRARPDISYPFIFEETSQYVGAKLKPGESSGVVFKMEVLKDADVKNYSINVILESLVGDNRYRTDDIMNVPVKQAENKSSGNVALTVVIVIVVISLILGINTYRSSKRKLKKK